jgi:hypothetical protein
MMKRQLCSLLLTGMLATGIAFAQDQAPPPDQNAPQTEGGGMGGHHGRGMMDPDQRLAHMTKRYNLSADQQSQIKPILQNEQQQMQAMHSDSSMSRDDKRSKMMSMHEADNQKIEAILNDQQKQKFEADQQKMQQRMQERQQGGGGQAQPQ